MDKNESFAYMVFSCSWNDDMASVFNDWYWGDFVEASMETEDQAVDPSEVWAYELEYGMSRVAPVQLTLGWDPRQTLLQVFAQTGAQPLFRGGYKGETNWLAFSVPEVSLEWQSVAPQNIPKPADFRRFHDLIEATIELAKEQRRSLLFVCGQGFDYESDAEYLSDIEPILKEAGMKFFDRHG